MKYVIGIDLGGTTVKGGLVDINGLIVKKSVKQTKSTKADVLKTIVDVINDLDCDSAVAVGIGSPGHIDSENGKVTAIGGNITDWANTDIKGYIQTHTRFEKIYVENDANCAGLCEAWLGSAKNIDYFVMLTLGTGVGGVLIDRGEVYNGGQFSAGEFGHMILYPGGRKCACGQNGCIETYTSGTGLENTYEELSGMRIKGEEVIELSKIDAIAKSAIERYAKDLAYVLVSIKNILAPKAIILGGGVINAREYWWDVMIEAYKSEVNVLDDMKIMPAQFLNDAGIIGASYLAFDKSDEFNDEN